ncbi:MAG: hypothetical protein IJI34_06020 [Clostridia bacterium]|nr:hypothetical protein [Clostridia bacterium]
MFKRLFRNWHRYVLWALLSVIFWGWVLSLVTDAPAERKVRLYAAVPVLQRDPLERALEEEGLPEGIKFVQASMFEYALIDEDQVLKGDLYLLPEQMAAESLAFFAPIDREDFPGAVFFEADGQAYGILIYDEETGMNIGGSYFNCFRQERSCLFFSAESMHMGKLDDAAITIAQRFLKLQ